MSLVSAAQACANAEAEIPDFGFARVHAAARSAWSELLARVQVGAAGVERDTLRLFYSSVRGGAVCVRALVLMWRGCSCTGRTSRPRTVRALSPPSEARRSRPRRHRREPKVELDRAVLRLAVLQRASPPAPSRKQTRDAARQWDTYRTLYPLFSLHDPTTFARIVRGMVDIQKHEGALPACIRRRRR